MTAKDLFYCEDDTYPDLYAKLNNKYLNPLVTSNLILAKAIRECWQDPIQPRIVGEVIQGKFGGKDDEPGA